MRASVGGSVDFVFGGLELEIAALDPESSAHLHSLRAAIVFRLLAADLLVI
jgi:hypothetical protein